jgi:hypothetical protein
VEAAGKGWEGFGEFRRSERREASRRRTKLGDLGGGDGTKAKGRARRQKDDNVFVVCSLSRLPSAFVELHVVANGPVWG